MSSWFCLSVASSPLSSSLQTCFKRVGWQWRRVLQRRLVGWGRATGPSWASGSGRGEGNHATCWRVRAVCVKNLFAFKCPRLWNCWQKVQKEEGVGGGTLLSSAVRCHFDPSVLQRFIPSTAGSRRSQRRAPDGPVLVIYIHVSGSSSPGRFWLSSSTYLHRTDASCPPALIFFSLQGRGRKDRKEDFEICGQNS